MQIRMAEIEDLQELLDIYNYEVIHGVATLDLNPKTLSEWREWFDAHNIENHPLIVAKTEGRVAGYASLSAYREKEAYKSTVELSVYISPDFRRRGIATALMKEIIEMAKKDETIHSVVSVITAGNEASIKLHQKYGFTFCGAIHEVGYKAGAYQDIENYELMV
ncbi:MAG: N-acetyltransferase family protein [Clostridia bacterium]|nr:N-acetyltransferase family protein [Clostridia bacterium]